MNKAVFLDRDGVVNELVYHQEQEVIDSPFTVNQFKLIPGVPEAIKTLQLMGYLVILISNQPGIAKGQMTADTFANIRRKMADELAKGNVHLDGEYYCLHHPEAIVGQYRANCDCRKPRPGLLFKAAGELDLDLANSWFIGDNLSDIQAGKSAGTKTILLGKMKCELCNFMDEKDVRPDTICANLLEAASSMAQGEASAEVSLEERAD